MADTPVTASELAELIVEFEKYRERLISDTTEAANWMGNNKNDKAKKRILSYSYMKTDELFLGQGYSIDSQDVFDHGDLK